MQDKAIIEIGKIKGNRQPEAYQNFIENMFPNQDNYDMILAVFVFGKDGGILKCRFERVEAKNTSKKNYLQYAYRKGSARGGDITFTTKFGDMDKKFKVFYPKQVKAVIASAKKVGLEKEVEIFNALNACLAESGDEVKDKLKTYYEGLDKKKQQSTGFSVRFEGLDGQEYLSSFKIIQQAIYNAGTEGKVFKYKVRSEGKDNVCSICLDTKANLYGFGSPYKYATVDKPGLVSGFFNQKTNWKNYPICTDCALDFELGQKYISQKLRRAFYGKTYFLIPQLIISKNKRLLKKVISTLEELEYKEQEGGKQRQKESYLMKKIGTDENMTDQIVLNLLFYEENPTTKAMKIKLLLEEILPSRFRTLFVDVPEKVNARAIYKNAIYSKKEWQDLTFQFGLFKRFFDSSFYKIVQSVFMGEALAEDWLYSQFMQVIRSDYNKSKTGGYTEPTKFTILKAHMILAYLRELGIIKTKILKPMDQQEVDAVESTERKVKSRFNETAFLAFLKENQDFLNTNIKIGIFTVGIYARFLIDIQNFELKNTPFEKKLRGYNINPEVLDYIFIEAHKKISQYKGFYAYSGLRKYIKEYYMLNRHQCNEISHNELSFYFVAGLEFGGQFKTKKETTANEQSN